MKFLFVAALLMATPAQAQVCTELEEFVERQAERGAVVRPLRGDAAQAAVAWYNATPPIENATFDLVVVVHAPSEERVRRLVELRGLSESEASARVQSQATDANRLALADIVIDAGGTQEETLTRAHALYSVLQKCWPDRLSEAPGLYTTLQP
jgi:hypothetical protein